MAVELQGGSYRLLLLRQSGDDTTNRLFLAFRDSTSGRETYGGGRYLDLYQQSSNEVFIDFNRAYNPYCVYNSAYSCPLPPAENDLQLAELGAIPQGSSPEQARARRRIGRQALAARRLAGSLLCHNDTSCIGNNTHLGENEPLGRRYLHEYEVSFLLSTVKVFTTRLLAGVACGLHAW